MRLKREFIWDTRARPRSIGDPSPLRSQQPHAPRTHLTPPSACDRDALKQRKRETGSIEPLQQTKFRGRVLAGQDDRLTAAITAQPDATLRELREALKTSAGLATIWRAVNQLDLTVKKNRSRRRTTTA